MAVVVVTSAPGSPGVTTTTLALALSWPRDVLLADCDRDPAQPVLAGYLRGIDSGGRGLASVAQLHREGRSLHEELLRQTLPLTEGTSPDRRFLAGFAKPQAVRLFDGLWSALGEAFEGLDARGIDVIVDAGRIGAQGLPGGLAIAADAVVALTRSHLRGLAALRLYLPTLREQVVSLATETPLGVGIVGPDSPYSSAEIGSLFDVPVWAEFPDDPKAAAVLLDGASEPRKFRDQMFMGRMRAQAKAISDRITGLRASQKALVTHA